ncbi:MAG: carbonic anhydrase [Alphaproteobacteria bacterium]|nr:carbonic anhydrase [Alphaproteobacteria bacterium]
MPRFAAGVVKFQNEVYPENKDLFHELDRGQAPEALFITCSDSRIETAMITQTAPGELFICRNAGNIVPPPSTHTGGMSASIEFAVAALKVPHIVVCGHTQCGAMKGAMNPEGLDKLPYVRDWLSYSRGAVEIVEELGAGLSEDEKMTLLLRQNVILQLQHLRSHPSVARRLAKGDVELHGWVYDIKTGAVDAYDPATGDFCPVDVRYAAEMKRLAADCA